MYNKVLLDGVLVWNLNGELLPIIAGGKGGGGGTTTTVINTPAPTAEETELAKVNLGVAKQQSTQLTLSMAMNDPSSALGYLTSSPESRLPGSQFAGLEAYDTPEFRASLTKQQGINNTNDEISTLANRRLIEQITGVAQLSPEEQANLDTMYGAAQTQGESNIKRFGQENAAMRGLNMTDSPAAAEFARATGEFNLGLQGAKAGAALDLGQASKLFNQNVSDFQNSLNQQSYQNRLGLVTNNPGMGMPMLDNMSMQRARAAGSTATQQNQAGPMNWVGLATGAFAGAGMAF